MIDQPIVGQRYRYVGNEPKYRDYRGLEGVATTVSKVGKCWLVELSNIAQWRGLNLGSPIFVMNTELEPASTSLQPAPAVLEPAQATDAIKPAGSRPFEGPEDELVRQIREALTEQGYLVCVVGQLRAKGAGTTVGYPDLSVRRKGWPDGMACLLEVKTAEGVLSPEQEELLKLGWSHVVRSVAGAISALTRFENNTFAARHGCAAHPAARQPELASGSEQKER